MTSLSDLSNEELDALIAQAERVQLMARTQMMRDAGGKTGEEVISGMADEGSFASLGMKNLADSPRSLTEGISFLGTLAKQGNLSPSRGMANILTDYVSENFTDAETGEKGRNLGASALKQLIPAVEATQRTSETIENLPFGIGEFTKDARTAIESEREALRAKPGAGFGTDAGIFLTEFVSDPIEFLPGGIMLKGLKTVALAGALTGVGAVAGVKVAGKVGRKTVGRLAVDFGDDIGKAIGVAAEEFAEGEAKTISRAIQSEVIRRDELGIRVMDDLSEQLVELQGTTQKAIKAHQEMVEDLARDRVVSRAREMRDEATRVARELAAFPGVPPKMIVNPGKTTDALLRRAKTLEKSRLSLSLERRAHPEMPSGLRDFPLSPEPTTPVIGSGPLKGGQIVEQVNELGRSAPAKRYRALLAESAGETSLRAGELVKAAENGVPVRRVLPIGSPLRDYVDDAGNIVDDVKFQERLATAWHENNSGVNLSGTVLATEVRNMVRESAKDSKAVRVYGELAKKNKRAVEEMVDGDLLGLAEDTGSPMIHGKDAPVDVLRRLRAIGIEDKALNLVKSFRLKSDDFLATANQLNTEIGSKKIGRVENWIYHNWDFTDKNTKSAFDAVNAPPKGKAKAKSEMARSFPTYRVGLAKGMKPTSLRFSDNIGFSYGQYARALATKRTLRDLASVNVAEDGGLAFVRAKTSKALPDGYVHIKNPELQKVVAGPGGSVVGIHKSILPVMERLFSPRSYNAFDKVISFSKMGNLGMSTFHQFTIAGESSPAILGPIHGLTASGKFGFGIPGLAPNARKGKELVRLGELLQEAQRVGRVDGLAPMILASELGEAGVRRGLHYGIHGEPGVDITRAAWRQGAAQVIAKVDKASPMAAKALEVPVKIQESINLGLWDGLHMPIKHYAFNVLYDGMLQVKRGNWEWTSSPLKKIQQKMLANVSDEEIGYRVGKVINDEFGGQLFDAHIKGITGRLSDPKVLVPLRRVMLAPDWLISSIRMSTAAFDVKDPVRMIAGMRHWKNFALGSAMYANVANLVFTGHTIFDDPNKKSNFHIRLPWRDSQTGEMKYIRWGKQFQEGEPLVSTIAEVFGIEGLEGPLDIARRKVNPSINALMKLFTEADESTPLGVAEDRAEREGRELSDLEYGFWLLTSVGSEGLLPFSFRETGFPLSPFALSKGLNTRDEENHLVDAIVDDDTEAIAEILRRLETIENMNPQALDRLYSSAMKKARLRLGITVELTEEERIERRHNVNATP